MLLYTTKILSKYVKYTATVILVKTQIVHHLLLLKRPTAKLALVSRESFAYMIPDAQIFVGLRFQQCQYTFYACALSPYCAEGSAL